MTVMSERSAVNIGTIVHSNLCIGCGLCTVACPQAAIAMNWQTSRFWQPVVDSARCNACRHCVKVCPHSPACILDYAAAAHKEGVRFGLADADYYIAYDKDQKRRIRSASGGALTALLQDLLESGLVKGVVASMPQTAPVGSPHFTLKIMRNVEDLDAARSSHYHPLSYDQVLAELAKKEEEFAFVGVPCILRGLRRLPAEFQRKIKYRVGLVCSHNVSAAFIDSLAVKEGVADNVPFQVNLRDKVGIADANNFNNCFKTASGDIRRNRFATAFTRMWRNYFFARECCLYCGDFYGRDADVTVKDAWGRLSSEPLGISLVIVKNNEIARHLAYLRDCGRLHLEQCDQDEICKSQRATPAFKHEEIRDRVVWKRALREELAGRAAPQGWNRRWWTPASREYWRLVAVMKLSNFFYFRFSKVPVTSLLGVTSPLKINGVLMRNAVSGLKPILKWPWRIILRPLLKTGALFLGYRRKGSVKEKNPLRVLVTGGYGYGNVGDEAQLAANLQLWRQFAEGCRLAVLTPNPAYTEQMHHQIRVELAPRKALFGWKGREYFGSEKKFKLIYFPLAVWLLFNACLIRAGLPTFGLTTSQARLLDELKDADVLFLSGGGYLTGMTLTRLWDHMLVIRLAHALGVPTILSGQTIGVFKDPISPLLAKWGLKKAELIYLRDPLDSPAALKGLGISAERFKSTFDDALFFSAASTPHVDNLLRRVGGEPGKPYMAVNVHYWGQSADASRVIMKSVASTLDRLSGEFDLQVIFVPMALSDESAMNEVGTAMQRPWLLANHGYQPDLAVALVQNAFVCITMKHHPIIFAMAASVPTVAMTFDDYYFHKNYGAMKVFHQERHTIKCSPDELEIKLYDNSRQLLLDRDASSRQIAAVVKELRPKSGEVIQRFVDSIRQ